MIGVLLRFMATTIWGTNVTNTTPNNPVSSGAVIEREEGHMNDAKLLNAFINDPSALAQFAAHLLDAIKTKLGWSDADVNPVTFGEMTDDQLLSHLSEFLGSGVINTTINGGFIEQAQENVAFNNLSEEELAEVEGASDPRVIAAKLRKAGLEAAQAKADREQERRMEERRAEWDAEMHDFGGKQYTGAQISQIYKWLDKKENQDKIRQQMKAEGKTDKEIADASEKVTLRALLWEKMRTATEEERKRLLEKYNALGTPEVKDMESMAAVGSGVDLKSENSKSKNIEMVSPRSAASTYIDATENDEFKSARDKNMGGNFSIAANGNMPVSAPAPAVVGAVYPSVNKIDNSFSMM